MTARETIMLGNEGARFRDVIDNLDEDIILECMHDYAKEKCQQLLEIVAEKASARISYVPGSVNRAVVNKDSILNAVNLDEFIN